MSAKLSRIPVAILAGGLGTRLRPAVGDRPKALADVGGRPFAAHVLDRLAAWGFAEVVLCVGHGASQVEDALGHEHGSLRLRYSREDAPLGTAGALRLALPLLEGDEVMVLNGDSWCDVDLEAAWDWHQRRRSEATLILVEVPDATRYGHVDVDPEGSIRRFAEKQEDVGPGWINAGIYLLAHARIASIRPGVALSLERDVLPGWVGDGLWGFGARARFLDIGTPRSYASASGFFAAGRAPRR